MATAQEVEFLKRHLEELLFLKLLTWKPGWDWSVGTSTQFSSIAGVTTWVSFAIWLRPAQSGLLKPLWNTSVSLSLFAEKAGAQSFIIGARAGNRHFQNPPSGPLPTGEGLFHVEVLGTPVVGALVPPM